MSKRASLPDTVQPRAEALPVPAQRAGYRTSAEREIDSRLLRHFLAIVECRGFTAAAEVLNVTQPALTKSIHKLENILGVKLLERHRRSVIPTPFGEILAARARLVELEVAHALSEIEAMRGGLAGSVNIGIGPSFINYISAVALAVQARRPNLRINVSVDVMDSLLKGLIGGSFDAICTSLEFPSYPEIAKEPLFEGNHFVIAAPDHRLRSFATVEPKQLLAFPWVAFSHDNMGIARMGAVFAVNHLPPPSIAVTTNSPAVMFDLIRRSEYLASIPSLLKPTALAAGLNELPIRDPLWRVTLGVAYRQAATQSAGLHAFIQACRVTTSPAAAQ